MDKIDSYVRHFLILIALILGLSLVSELREIIAYDSSTIGIISLTTAIICTFARTTFCWFPPDRFPAIWFMLLIFTDILSAMSLHSFSSFPRSRNIRFLNRSRFGRAIFSRIDRQSTRPYSFLSSVTMAIPLLIA